MRAVKDASHYSIRGIRQIRSWYTRLMLVPGLSKTEICIRILYVHLYTQRNRSLKLWLIIMPMDVTA